MVQCVPYVFVCIFIHAHSQILVGKNNLRADYIIRLLRLAAIASSSWNVSIFRSIFSMHGHGKIRN